ncbi:dynein assembly factor 1 axonemal [Phtheirospermum japonicum]|uniref:Dynein assembly factor 1 axonemal n=1 Tax=Phtheirospermum japonicum TaxID=374723 RepID=A0A830C9R6_9LAMI|nr:dynein assembly factor 1 axonemal [Phtheirospermum japonicum]
MVRFSCFQTQSHSHKHKKTVHRSSETMQKTLEDSSQNNDLRNSEEIKPCLKEEVEHNDVSDHVTDYSPTASEEMEAKYSTDNDIAVHNKTQFKKSQSLGSGLNWEQRTSGGDRSEDETDQRFSYEHVLPSDSVQVDSDFTKNVSVFSFGDRQPTEKEGGADKDDACLSGPVDSDDLTPRTRPVIVKSSSLPRMGSPYRCSASYLVRSRSSEDLNTFYSRKEGVTHEDRRQVQYQETDNSVFNYDDKNKGENPADENDEAYNNYVGSAKDWIIPVSDGVSRGKCVVGEETSSQNWDEVPAKDFRLKRIEEWVINLQHCGPMDESNESEPPFHDQELPEGNALLEEPAAVKSEVKVSPGMEAAKRYISSLNASATAAQLTNLGLVVIPFLSAFGSLKALNLSGNAIDVNLWPGPVFGWVWDSVLGLKNTIVRIAAGALPRGLHILNLSKNSISTIEGLRDLTRLRVLDLSYNRILRIGHAGNKISEVEGLHRLLKLNVLDLRFNKISTTKCLGQLAANYNCLQALSLEGNPAQKNVGDEQLKKYVQSLLPHLTYYNRQSIKVGTMKDGAERSARLGISSHQVDRGLRAEVKNARKGSHGIVAQKVSSSTNHGRKTQGLVAGKVTRSGRHGRLPPSGIKTTTNHGQQITMDVSSKLMGLKSDFSFPRSRSEGNLGAL